MVKMTGKVEKVFIAPEVDSLVSQARPKVEVNFEGIQGDRHAGLTMLSNSRTPYYPRGTRIRNSRQVSIVSVEELALIAERMGLEKILPEWLGANLLISGIPQMTQLASGLRLFFENGVTLVNDGENKPCLSAGKSIEEQSGIQNNLAQAFPKKGMGLRGLVAWVEKPGLILPNETITIQLPG